VAHLYFAWIHPYGDGNGRTARLIELRVLIEAGVPTPSAHVLSNHYNLTRADYYRHLDQASRTADGVLGFVDYAVRGFVDGLREQLATIREQQFGDRREQYIYQSFGEAKSVTQRRQRMLVLEMSEHAEPIPKAALRRLSGELAEAYGGKTDKTLTRDVNALVKGGLIERRDNGFVPPASPNRGVPAHFGRPGVTTEGGPFGHW
jgi:Fic family protein